MMATQSGILPGMGPAESPAQRYADLVRTPEGVREAGLRSQLWEQHYRRVVTRQSPGGLVTAEAVQRVYVMYRRQWEAQRTGVQSNYLPSTRWLSIWPRAAQFCERNGISPELLVRLVFRQQHDERMIQPNRLVSPELHNESIQLSSGEVQGEREEVEVVRLRCLNAFAELRRKAGWLLSYSSRPLAQEEVLWIAATEQLDGPYCFPIYCVAATQAAWRACETLRSMAFRQWQLAPREYLAVLNDLNPPEWRPI